jgi:hypothetical protein
MKTATITYTEHRTLPIALPCEFEMATLAEADLFGRVVAAGGGGNH